MDFNHCHSNLRAFYRYALAIFFFALALALRFWLLPVEDGLKFITFYPTLVICFYLCGIGPGILMTLLSASVDYYIFTPPYWQFTHHSGNELQVGVYLIGASLIGLIVSRMNEYVAASEKMQSDLLESEQRYLSILEDQTELICRFSMDGTLLYVNQAYCRFFGKERDALIGKSWHPDAFSEDIPLITAKLNTLTPSNPIVTIENRVVSADGSLRWGQFVNQAFFTADGTLKEMQSVGRDITSQKQMETENLELYKRLAQISARVPGMIYQYKLRPDGSACIPYTSEAIRDIFRLAPEEVKQDASAVFSTLHPDDSDGVFDSIRQSAASLQVWKYEFRVRFPDGCERWLYGNALPNREEDGSTLWHGFITDITEQKQTEIALQFESEKNQVLLRNASDGIHILDSNGNVVEASDSFCAMLGYSRTEVIGMNVCQWDTELNPEEVIQVVRQQFEQPVRSQFERRHRRKDGSTFDVEISGYPLKLDGQRLIFNSSRDITERKEASEKIRFLLTEQKAILESDLIGIAKTKDRLITWANPRIEKMFGYEPGELIGKSTRLLYLDEAAYETVGAEAYPLLGLGEIYRSELENVRKDGRHIWTDLRGVNLGTFTGESLWTFLEITERKAIEQLETYRGKVLELLATEAPVEDILNAIVRGIENMEPAMLCSILNSDAEGRHLNLGAAPSLPDFYNTAIQGLEISPGAGSCGTAAYTGKRVIVEDIQTHPAWTLYKDLAAKANLGSCWSEPILSSSNRVLGAFAIYHHQTSTPTAKDIVVIETAAKLAAIAIEQKLTREELIHHREHLEELVKKRTLDLQAVHAQLLDTQFAMEMARIGIRWVDTETGQIVYSNQYAAEMLGYSIEDMLTMRIQDFDPNFPIKKLQPMIESIRRNGYGQVETLNKTKDGRDVPVDISFYYLPKREQSPARLIGFITDITSRKEAELALRQAKLEAESASQAKSNFLANMSHEIRTPMNGIIGLTDVLMQMQLTQAQRRMLSTIQNSSLSLLAILNDILDFSKIEAGKLEVECIPTPLRQVIEELWQLMGVEASRKNIQLELHIDAELPDWIFSDPMRLRQILFNLLSNALKFVEMEKGKVSMHVLPFRSPDGQNKLQFRVIDNGIGIHQDMVGKLFQAFTQADESTARNYGGTGLGLSITQRLVELMQGVIRVKSSPGFGAEFIVELPLQVVPSDQLPLVSHNRQGGALLAKANHSPATTPNSHPISLSATPVAETLASHRLILVVEDNEINREVMYEQLGLLGYAADMAEDGEVALAMWRSGRYALLLTDCQMPKLDGYRLATAIREEEPIGIHRPIIGVTANAMRDERERCLESGMDDMLSKPFRLDQLSSLLRQWLPLAKEALKTVADDAYPDIRSQRR